MGDDEFKDFYYGMKVERLKAEGERRMSKVEYRGTKFDIRYPKSDIRFSFFDP
jgi:hypothetical protein